MSKWKQFFLSPVCVGCGSFFCGPALFCNDCYDHFIVDKLCKQNSGSHVGKSHFYLFDWNSCDADEFSQLVYRLKSDSSKFALDHYAGLLTSRLQERQDKDGFTAVVPIPSANSSSVHALILAKKFAEITGLPLLNPLEKIGPGDQKTLSAAERRRAINIRIRSSLNEVFTDFYSGPNKYIFVDDVLTTGQSFKQASTALGGNNDNIIGTLFYRNLGVQSEIS